MPTIYTTAVALFLTLSTAVAAVEYNLNRRLLHQPLFPFDDHSPVISQPPLLPPSPQPQPQQQQPKYPFSTLSPPDTQNQFFPFYPSPPPPPSPPSSTDFATFPANISSLILPSSSSHSNKPISHKLIAVIISVALLSAALFATFLLLFLRRHHLPHKTDSLRLVPPDTTPSDNTSTTDISKKPPTPQFPRHSPTSTSSEFLYLGTLVSSRDANVGSADTQNEKNTPAAISLDYQRLGSPELHPLPPLPRQHSHQNYKDATANNPRSSYSSSEENEEEFFSPRGSTGNHASPFHTRSSPPKSLNPINLNSPAHSSSSDNSPLVVLNSSSPRSLASKSPDSLLNFPAPLPRYIPPPPSREPRTYTPFSPSSSEDGARNSSPQSFEFLGVRRGPTPSRPPPPPPPPPKSWESKSLPGPPELVAPSRTVVAAQNMSGAAENSEGKSEETNLKPKLKPLHWDKVRASSDRAMVWDQLKSSSFQ